MHNSLRHQPMPAALMPFVPQQRKGHSGVRFELGQIAPEPVPPVQYQPMPGEYFDPTMQPVPRLAMVCVDVARGPGCGVTFYPKRTTAMRCPTCRDVRWHGPPPAKPLATRPAPDTPRHRAKRYAARRGQLGRRSAA